MLSTKLYHPKWRIVTCYRCDGAGVVSMYSAYDFEGPGDCNECGGSGQLWIVPSGHLFEFPGGRAMGMWPGAYEKGRANIDST